MAAHDDDILLLALGEIAAGVMRGTYEGVDKIFPQIRSGKYPTMPLITFQDVVAYFQDQRPDDFRIEAGALIRRPDAGGIVLYQVFLGSKDAIVADDEGVPFGRAVRARAIDDELASRFGRTNLIIFR